MTTPTRPRVHILYEYGVDTRPHTPSYLRFIRPFTHPAITDQVEATFGRDYQGQPADLVILDRLWRPDVTLPLVQQLVERIHQAGARFVYALDDSFFDLAREKKGWPPPGLLPIVEFCLRQAYGVIVTTAVLKARLDPYNPRIFILPHALDERLLVRRFASPGEDPLTIGYMGTLTHDDDLQLALPAIRNVCRRHTGRVQFHLIGAVRNEGTKKLLADLPIHYIPLDPRETEYPLFMLWFTANTRWDIAIAPLRDTPFNQCKSDIKFLDYAAIGAAGMFSGCPAYSATVQHQDTGWLANNTPDAWEDGLESLIADPNLRWQLASHAISYLYNERILAKRAADWTTTVHQLLRS